VKHATPARLDSIEPLLESLRKFEALREIKRGIFYLKSTAYLYFHEDPAGLFADVKLKGKWSRLNVSAATTRKELLAAVRRDLSGSGS
jgi:hypothetical protein